MKRTMRIASLVLAFFLMIGSFSLPANAASTTLKTGIGRVNASSLRLRSAPSTASQTLGYAGRNEVVVVTEKVGQWYKVIYNLQTGYMHSDYLKVYADYHAELGYGKVLGTTVNIRSGPGTNYASIAQVPMNARTYILGLSGTWFRVLIGNTLGYIRSDYLDLTQPPLENAASAEKPLFYINGQSTGAVPSAAAMASKKAKSIVETGKQYMGVPYLWGGTTPKGFDCSGFVQYVFAKNGVTVPRTSAQQYGAGKWVAKADLKVGDLVFFNTSGNGVSHVGIYIGDNQFLHCSSSKGVTITSLSNSYWAPRYLGAKNVL